MKNLFELMKSHGKVGLTIAFGLITILSSAQDTDIKAAQDKIKAAQELYSKDRKKAAIEELQKAITTYPAVAKVYYYLGHTQLLIGDKAAAKASFDKGVATDPKEPLNYVGQGHILMLAKNVAQAKLSFEKAISLGKNNIASFNAIAEAYLVDKNYQKDALAMLERAKGIDENNAQTYLLIGDAHAPVMGQGGMSASAYERAGELDNKLAIAEFKLGELFMNTNMPVAEEHYKKAVAIDPTFAEAHRELGELYYKKKDGSNAVKHYKAYLDLTDSPEKDDRFRYAFFLFLAKDYGNANKEFDELRKKSEVSSTTLKFAAQSQLKSGNLAESEKVFIDYMKHPQTKVDADDYNNLAELLIRQGKDSLAVNAYESSIALDQNQPEILQNLIKYYFDKKKNSVQAERIC